MRRHTLLGALIALIFPISALAQSTNYEKGWYPNEFLIGKGQNRTSLQNSNGVLKLTGGLQVTGGTTDFTGSTLAGLGALGSITLTANSNLTATAGTGTLTWNSTVTNASDQAVVIVPIYTGGATDTLTYTALQISAQTATNAAGTDTVNGLLIGAMTDPGATITSRCISLGAGWDAQIYSADTTTIWRQVDASTIVIDDGTNTLVTITDSGTTGDLDATGVITAEQFGSIARCKKGYFEDVQSCVGDLRILDSAGNVIATFSDDGANGSLTATNDLTATDDVLATDDIFATAATSSVNVRQTVEGSEAVNVYGSIQAWDCTTPASESLQDGALTGAPATWTATNDCALAADAATWTFAGGAASTLTQAQADLTIAGVGSRHYVFAYTVSGITGTPSANITTAFGSASAALTIAAGAQSTQFESTAAPVDFVITSTLIAGQAFTLDTLSLKECIQGNVEANGLFTGGGTTGIKVLANGNVGILNTAPTVALDVTGAINVSTSVTIAGVADGTDALILTAGDILVSDGDLTVSDGDFDVIINNGDSASVTKAAATSATAAMAIANTTGATDTAGSLGASISLTVANYADDGAADTHTGLSISVIQNASDAGTNDITYGLSIGNLGGAATAAVEAAQIIGSGWDYQTLYNDTTTRLAVANTGSISIEDDAGNVLFRIADNTTVGNLAGDATIGADPAFVANGFGLGTTGWIFEGSGADTNETLVTAINPTADRTLSLPDASGTFAVSATSPATLSAAGDIGIGADSVDATHLADALTPEAGSSIVGADTIGADPQLPANAIGFGTTGVIFEGATGGAGNALEGLLTCVDPTVDRTWTLPDAGGTLAVSATSPATLSAAGDIGIAADSIDATHLTDALTPEAGSSIVGADTLAGDPQLPANAIGFATTGVLFEGATGGAGNAFEGLLTPTDPTADRTWTLPDASGTFAVSASSPVSLSAAGAIGITADAIDATHLADALTPEAGSSIVGADTLGGDPQLPANAIGFATTGILFEGATGGAGNAFEALLTVTDPTADNTFTFPDASGEVSLLGQTIASAEIVDETVTAADISNTLCLQILGGEFNPDETGITYAPVAGTLDAIGSPPIPNAAETAVDWFVVPVACYVHNLSVTVDVAPGAGNDRWDITLRDDAGSTTLTCTIDEVATTCTAAGPSAQIAAGSKLAVMIDQNQQGAAANPTAAAVMNVSFCIGQ